LTSLVSGNQDLREWREYVVVSALCILYIAIAIAARALISRRQTQDTEHLSSNTGFAAPLLSTAMVIVACAWLLDTARVALASLRTGAEVPSMQYSLPIVLLAYALVATVLVQLHKEVGDVLGRRLTNEGQGPRRETEKKLLLLVHGLGGSPRKTWGKFTALMRDDVEMMSQWSFTHYKYPSVKLTWKFWKIWGTYPRIQELADGLATEIRNTYCGFPEIVLVCHSLGGLVGRKYAVDLVLDRSPHRLGGAVLFATPNAGASLAKVGSAIPWSSWQLKQLCGRSDFLEELNDLWFRLHVQERIRTLFVIAARDELVDSASARLWPGNQDVETVVGTDHREVVQPTSRLDTSYVIVRRFIGLAAVSDQDSSELLGGA